MEKLTSTSVRTARAKAVKGIAVWLAVFMFAMIAAGCSRYCARHFQPSVIIKDSLITSTITEYKDTTIYLHLPGKVVKDSVPVIIQIPGQPVKITPNRLSKELEYCQAEAWIKENKMFLSLIQKDTLIEWNLKNAIRSVLSTSNYYKKEVQRLIIENKDKQRQELNRGRKQGAFTGLLIAVLIVAGYYFLKFRK